MTYYPSSFTTYSRHLLVKQVKTSLNALVFSLRFEIFGILLLEFQGPLKIEKVMPPPFLTLFNPSPPFLTLFNLS